MNKKEIISQNLDHTLKEAFFSELPNYYRGKVRENYDLDDGQRILIATDRQSAFDVILTEVPFKGQVLTEISKFWFEKTVDIVKNHVIEFPDPNVVVVKKVRVLPIEIVVRAYLTGTTTTSSWWHYQNNNRIICGLEMPAGMKKNEAFAAPIITPTTKDFSGGHDMPISVKEIIEQEIVSQETWEKIARISLELFKRGTEIAAQNGLILVDTKYEIGEDEKGEIILVDEIHTPDSSRFWMADSYRDRMQAGKEPESLDKEFLRLFLSEQGFVGEGEIPTIPPEKLIDFSAKYIALYEKVTGKDFIFPDFNLPVKDRIKSNLQEYF